jgi:CRP/FNR family transcriptional regulator
MMKARRICRKTSSFVEFIKKSPFKRFDKGEILLNEGDEPTKLFAIKQGYVKITALNNSGTQQLIWIAGSRDVVPTELIFSLGGAVRFFYTACTDLVAYEVDKAVFLESAYTNKDLMGEVAKTMGGYHDRLLRRIHATGQPIIRDKLVHTLYDLASQLDHTNNSVDLVSFGLRLTHQDLADMVGATRETVSIELHKLRLKRLISYNRRKFVVHTKKLAPLIET